MKKIIFIVGITAFMTGTIFTSCKSNAEKVENAEGNLEEAKDDQVEAQMDYNQAQQDSIADYKKFKTEYEARILAHEKSIADFKARVNLQKKENRAKYEKELADLEQKNTDMRKMLDDYKNDGKDNWSAFKIKFKDDMDKLGEKIRNINVTIETSK